MAFLLYQWKKNRRDNKNQILQNNPKKGKSGPIVRSAAMETTFKRTFLQDEEDSPIILRILLKVTLKINQTLFEIEFAYFHSTDMKIYSFSSPNLADLSNSTALNRLYVGFRAMSTIFLTVVSNNTLATCRTICVEQKCENFSTLTQVKFTSCLTSLRRPPPLHSFYESKKSFQSSPILKKTQNTLKTRRALNWSQSYKEIMFQTKIVLKLHSLMVRCFNYN